MIRDVKLYWMAPWTDEDIAIIGDASNSRMHAICDGWLEYRHPALTANEVMAQINEVHSLSQEMDYGKVY